MRQSVDWHALEALAEKTSSSGPDGFTIPEWQLLEDALIRLETAEDWCGLLRLRDMFRALVKGETSGGISLVQRLNDTAVLAAERSKQYELQARYLFDRGENRHRQGYHLAAIEAFSAAQETYEAAGENTRARECYYFSALPYRAIGKVQTAREILSNVLRDIGPHDPWRANPLQVLSWLEKDAGNYERSEEYLREALQLYQATEGEDSPHVVQTLADLGEIVGIQGRRAEAVEYFCRSAGLADRLGGQYNRQGARARLKHAELLVRDDNLGSAMGLLNEADDLIRSYGHYYDLMWRIELARVFIFAKQRRWGAALRKLRATMRLRNELGLRNSDLIRNMRSRSRRGTALPK